MVDDDRVGREPIGRASRRSGEMQPPIQPAPTPHSQHDLTVLAAAAGRNPDRSEVAAASVQAASCPECAALAQDLRMLSAGLAELPRSRPVPRDMRLTADQAARLRRSGAWRRLLRPFGAAGLPGLRPLAASLMTLGLAGLLLTAIPLGFGMTASAPLVPVPAASSGAEQYGGAAYSPVPAAAGASSEPKDNASGPPALGPGSSPAEDVNADGAGRGAAGSPASQVPEYTNQATGPSLPPPLTLVSLGLLAAGLGLFALLIVARRAA